MAEDKIVLYGILAILVLSGASLTMNYLNNSGTSATGLVVIPSNTTAGGNGSGVPPPGCSDSDGTNPNTAGDVQTYTSYSSCSYKDYCYDTKNVVEQYCFNGLRQSKIIACPTGYTCFGGACATSNTIVSCTDNDKYQNVSIFGQVATTDQNGNVKFYPDTCTSTTNVVQYYCTTSSLGFGVDKREYYCPTGTTCSNGACKAQPVCGNNICEAGEKTECYECITPNCTTSCKEGTCPRDCGATSWFCQDSDNGKDYYTTGGVSEGNSGGDAVIGKVDYCNDGYYLTEYYCPTSTSASSSVSFYCRYGCANGACKPNPSCLDSDGDKNYYVSGQATGTTGTKRDYCYSTTTVIEYYCGAYSYPLSTSFKCSSGCSDGACITPPVPNPVPTNQTW